jgi:site-specific DNA-methyltransferase (adenine-specific)
MEKSRNRSVTLNDEEMSRYNERIAYDAARWYIDKTICGDTLSVLKQLPDSFADLIIVDPPYNLTKDFGDIKFKASDSNAYREYLESWMPDLVAKLKPCGTLYMCGDWKCSSVMQDVLERHLTVMNRITWQREKGRGAKSNWKNSMEDIWFTVKNPEAYCFNVDAVKTRRKVIAPYRENGKPKDWEDTSVGAYRMTCPSNFWDDITVPFWSMPENTEHPTQKPEKLIAKLILASSNAGDMVFDPFLGSGTTSVVAKKLGRHYCGIEMNNRYCCLAEKRLELAETDKAIQGYSDGIFWERNSGK